MIYVIATIQITAGRRDDFVAEFKGIVPAVLAEDGCIQYGPTVDIDTGLDRQAAIQSNEVVVIEKWKSIEHLQAHLTSPHVCEFRDRTKDFVEGASLRIVEPA